MTIRETIEDMERETLSPYATLSENSRGRDREEPQCDIRPVFQRDRDRILHCKSFRRLKNKTQVFLTPKGDHYRTRMSHTLEVSQNARTIGKALRLTKIWWRRSHWDTIWDTHRLDTRESGRSTNCVRAVLYIASRACVL